MVICVFIGFQFSVSTALSNDSEAVVFKVSKAVGTALNEFHLPVEAFSDPIAAGEPPSTTSKILRFLRFGSLQTTVLLGNEEASH